MAYGSKNNRVFIFFSEKQLEDALNSAVLSPTWGVASKAGNFVFAVNDADDEIISEEAQDVLDRMNLTDLTSIERTAIITFVNAMSLSLGNGDWALIDEFFSFGLTGAVNPLQG